MQTVATLSISTEAAKFNAPVVAKTLRGQLFVQSPGDNADLFNFRIIVGGAAQAATAEERIVECGHIFFLRRRRLLDGKSRCRNQQRQGDDEVFHGNSLEAISGNVKRAA